MAFCMRCGIPQPEEAGLEQDIAENRTMAALSYLGPLCLIPLLAAQRSPFAYAHAAQGVHLLLLELAYLLCTGLLTALLALIGPALAAVCSAVFAAGFLAFAALSVLGLASVRRGECLRLPVVGALHWIE